MFSIQANTSSQIALQALATTSAQGNVLQNELSTGLKVSGADDNAAVFAVAQGIRANLQGYDAVNSALQNAQGMISAALAGATTISNILTKITQTLTSLTNGSISDQQRQTYTRQFFQQMNDIQTTIASSSYNGINLIGWDISQAGPDNQLGVAFPFPEDVSVPSSPDGDTITIHANDLAGIQQYSVGTTAFIGFARLGYWVGGGAYDTNNDLNPENAVYVGTNIYDFAGVSRSEIQQNEAIAALAPLSSINNAFFTSPNATQGVQSVFNSALATFSNQVDATLASLSQDNANIQSQVTFNQSLHDALTDTLGNLVDADLAQVSAALTAEQTKETLAKQNLAIVNSEPKLILELFH